MLFDIADESEVSRALSANSVVGSMNKAVFDAEPELPGLQYALYEEALEGEQQWQDEDTQQQQQLREAADDNELLLPPGAAKDPTQQQQQQQQRPQQQNKAGSTSRKQPLQQQQRGQGKAQQGAAAGSRWVLGKLGGGLFRRAGRTLQQTIFPEGMSKLGVDQLYPNFATSSDPNTPFGTGRFGQFMTGILNSNMNAGGMMNLVGSMVGPSMGGAVATGRFTPVNNNMGNVINTGSGPGGLMVRQGPGGVTTGVYGGGWAGPYNTRTGQYGMGGNYGFARPYHGRVQGTAMVTVPSWVSPNSPNVTYPCPVGRGNGSMIAPGVPCGISMTAIPANMLPTVNGMPAGVDITPLSVSYAHALTLYTGTLVCSGTSCLLLVYWRIPPEFSSLL
jgi:hypothetical protein